MKFSVYAVSDKGGREKNEDSVLLKPMGERLVGVLADGLGAYGSGEIASQIVTGIFDDSSTNSESLGSSYIGQCLQLANQTILQQQTATCQMKTTAVVATVEQDRITLAHVGDSRGYYFKDGILCYQTPDHSIPYLAMLRGEITMDQIRFHEDRNRLIRAIGGCEQLRIDCKEISLRHTYHSAVLLCSDGFWEYVTETEMQTDLAKSETAKDWVGYLLVRAGRRFPPKHDNLSVAAVIIR